MKKILPVVLLSFLGLFSCRAYGDLSVAQFEKALQGGCPVQLVDVRTPDEFAAGHLAGAVNLDWYEAGFLERAKALLRADIPVLVYCRSGRRSAEAAAKLERAGFKVSNLKGGYIAWTKAGQPVTKYEVERFVADDGEALSITLIKHGSLEIRYKGLSFQIDPVEEYGTPTDYAAEFPKADVILVTHEHPDHLDRRAIADLTAPGTILYVNERASQLLRTGEVLRNGDKRTLPGGVQLEAVPAYNNTPGREKFHAKGAGNGYVLNFSGFRIYVAGDTEDISEMAQLKGVDVVFLPVNQPYTMTPEQCIAAARTLEPKVLIPYHYSETDLSDIPAALPGIDVRIRRMQ